MSYTTNLFIDSDKSVPVCEKNLSICLSTNGFSFSITSVKNELLVLGDIACDLSKSLAELLPEVKKAFADHGIVLFGFNKAELVVHADQFVWVPDHLYEEGHDRKYLEALCDPTPGMTLFCEHNEALGARMIFMADNSKVDVFRIAIPGLKVRCQHSALVNKDNMERSDMRSVMLVNLRDGKMDVDVFCNHKLQLSNTYITHTFDDAVYQSINVCKQLRLEEADMVVWVCGNIDRAHYAEMHRYFPKMDLYKGRPLTFANPEMSHIHTYKYAECLS